MDGDFTSFWSHYHTVQKWINLVNGPSQTAFQEKKSGTTDQHRESPSQGSGTGGQLLNSNRAFIAKMQDISPSRIDEISPEMLAFYRKTMEHRKQRDEKRRLEKMYGDQLDNKNEYRSACEIGKIRKGDLHTPTEENQQREYRLKSLYAKESMGKLRESESAIQKKFKEEFDKNKPRTWPNIPLRF